MNPYEVKIRERARIHTIYRTKDGTRVPSVTEILDELAKPYLVDWAWELGTEGINYKDIQEQYSDVGTLAHRFIHESISRKETPMSGPMSGYPNIVISLAGSAAGSFSKWRDDYVITPLKSELALVSENLGYGGTLDLLAIINGKTTLVDFKTGSGIFPTHFIQLAGYGNLVTENFPDIHIDRFMIVNLHREEPGYTVKAKWNLSFEWKIFESALNICKLNKELSK